MKVALPSAPLLFLGSACAQGISVAMLVLCLPRYGFAAFGEAAGYLLVQNLLSHIAILKSCSAFLRSSDDSQRQRAIATGSVAALVIAAAVTAITCAIIGLGGIESARIWIWLGPSLLTGAMYDLNMAILLQEGRSRALATARCVSAASIGAAQYALSFTSPTADSIAFSYFFGFLCGSMVGFRLKPFRDAFHRLRTDGRSALKPSRVDGIMGVGSSILETFGTYGISAALQAFSSPAIAGCYLTSQRVVQTPLALMAQAIAQAIQSWAPKATSREIASHFRRSVGSAGMVAFGLACLLQPLCGLDVADRFGASWKSVGPIVACLLISAPIFLLQKATDAVAVTHRKTTRVLMIRIMALVASLAPILLALGDPDSPTVVLQSIAAGAAFSCVGTILLLRTLVASDVCIWMSAAIAAVVLAWFGASGTAEGLPGTAGTIAWTLSGLLFTGAGIARWRGARPNP